MIGERLDHQPCVALGQPRLGVEAVAEVRTLGVYGQERAPHEHRPAAMSDGVDAVDLEGHLLRRLLDDVPSAGPERHPGQAERLDQPEVDGQHDREPVADDADAPDHLGAQVLQAGLEIEVLDPGFVHGVAPSLRVAGCGTVRHHCGPLASSDWKSVA